MEIGLPWLLVFGELFLVLLVAVISLLVVGAARRRRDRQAAMFLVGVVKENESKRSTETQELLQSKFGYADDLLKQTTHNIMRAEKLLFQRIVNMYVKRDVISLRELNIDVEAVTEPFRQLEVGAGGAPALSAPVAAGDDSAEVESLRTENAALKQELQITMETMSRMLGEYAAMFGGAPAGPPVELSEPVTAPTMEQALETGGAPVPEMAAAVELDSEPEAEVEVSLDAGNFDLSGDDPVEGLEELEELGTFDEPADDLDAAFAALDVEVDVPAEAAAEPADETVMIETGGDIVLDDGDFDLAADELNDIFGPDDALPGAMSAEAEKEENHEPMLDAEGQPMDDDLADIWADAMAEQDDKEKQL